MDYVSVLQDSIDTSVSMKLFRTRKASAFAHIFKSVFTKLPMGMFRNVDLVCRSVISCAR